ncbi:MAG: hypothetical protein K2X27_11835 [Candidatus Obscuribacterales bacterium]|nr:hypothetical protein [Candidatus Obscuribacterales bacterium]
MNKQWILPASLMALCLVATVCPANAHHAFWHQVKDQISGAHQSQWNYGYNRGHGYNRGYGTNWGYGNYWGPNGNPHAVRDAQHARQEQHHAIEDAQHGYGEHH